MRVAFVIALFTAFYSGANLSRQLPVTTIPFDINTLELPFEQKQDVEGLDLTVNSIASDDNNFLWVGTQAGLIRMDAYGFKRWQYNAENKNTLSNNFVTSLAFDDTNKHLWIGTQYGLNQLDLTSNTFTRFYHDSDSALSLSHNFVNTVFIDSKQRIWVGTSQGLNLYQNGQFQSFLNDPGQVDSVTHNNILDITEDHDGRIWIATQNGLNEFDNGKFKRHFPLRKITSKSGILTSVLVDNQGNLWLGTEQFGLLHYMPETGKIRQYSVENTAFKLPSNYIVSLAISDDQVWLGTSQGLALLDRTSQTVRPLKSNEGMNNIIRSIYQDRKDILWVGTWSNGLYRYNPNQTPIEQIPVETLGDKTEVIRSLVPGVNHTFWSSNIKYLYQFSPDKSQIKKFNLESINPQAAYTLPIVNYQTQKEYLLIDKIYQLTSDDRFIDKQLPSDIEDLLWYTAFFDSKNQLWLSSRRTGVYVLSPDFSEVLLHIPTSSVTYFAQVDKSTILFGATQNLFWVNLDDWSVEKHSTKTHPGLKNSTVTGYLEASNGRIWMATSGGLHEITRSNEGIKYTSITQNDGLPTDVITGPLEDKFGHLWLGSVDGLIRFNPETNTHQVFNTQQGAFSQYFIGQYYKDANHRLLFQGPKGISVINQSRIMNNVQSYPTVLSDFLLRGEPATLGERSPLDATIMYSDKITLQPEDRDFTFVFTTTHHSQPERVTFFYKLNGFDEHWIQTTAQNRQVKYTNLEPGNYVFEIHSVSGSGVSGEKTTINVTVLAFWYETLWFKVILFAVFAASILLWHRVRIIRIKQYNASLEADVRKRTQDIKILALIGQDISALRDIHDLLEHLYFHLSKSLDVSALAIGICDYAQGRIKFERSMEHGRRLPTYFREMNPGKEIAASCVRYKKSIHLKQYNDRFNYIDEDPGRIVGDVMETIVYLPLTSKQGHVIGCITVQSKQKNAYSKKDVEFIQTIANYTSIALDNALAYRDLENAATTDQLTGIFNRRAFINLASYQISVSKRSGLPITFCVVDIDNFKKVNDAADHECGNMILNQIANLIKSSVRQQDLVARLHGEKFVLMYPNTGTDGAVNVSTKLKEMIASQSFRYKDKAFQITATFGICEYSNQVTVEEIISNSEEALLKGKELGRNQVNVYEFN